MKPKPRGKTFKQNSADQTTSKSTEDGYNIRRNCCNVFSLQTAVMIFIWGDLFFLAILIGQMVFNQREVVYIGKEIIAKGKENNPELVNMIQPS